MKKKIRILLGLVIVVFFAVASIWWLSVDRQKQTDKIIT